MNRTTQARIEDLLYCISILASAKRLTTKHKKALAQGLAELEALGYNPEI